MTTLTLGAAQILKNQNGFTLRYVTAGSFMVGERNYTTEQAARDFCKARGIKIVHPLPAIPTLQPITVKVRELNPNAWE